MSDDDVTDTVEETAGMRRLEAGDEVVARIPEDAVHIFDSATGEVLIGSCVIIFSTGYQFWWFHGLTHEMRDTTAVKSHARPYEKPLARGRRLRRSERPVAWHASIERYILIGSCIDFCR